ncbi:MAG: hypothetical protein ACI89E_000231 [Planctomycetota bacterium]|jgi:hypothetical protein
MKSDSSNPNSSNGPLVFGDDFLDEIALDLVLEVRTQSAILAATEVGERDALQALMGEASFALRVQALQDWVGETRGQLVDWSGVEDEQAAALSPRILQNSTRRHAFRSEAEEGVALPQGLWGDAKILVGFMRKRLASSVALRVAAASLIAHLIALPALGAYIYWAQPEDTELVIRFDPSQPDLPEEILAVAPEELLEEDSNLWSALGLHETNAIAGARYELAHMEFGGLTEGVQEPWATWVDTRIARLIPGVKPQPLRLPLPQTAPSLAHVLAFEMAMDSWVLGREGWNLQGVGMGPLVELLNQERDGASSALAHLAGAALLRALEYGLLADLHTDIRAQIASLPDSAAGAALLGEGWFQWLRSLEAGTESNQRDWGEWFQSQR